MRAQRSLDVGTNIWLFNSNTFFTQASLAIFGLIFNLHLAGLGLREDYIGLFWFANTAALGGSAIPAGFISNRLGAGRCLAVASLVMAACMAVVGLLVEPIAIVVMGALLGSSTALLFVPGGPFMMENCRDEDRLKVFSVNAAIVSVAAVLGNLASGYLPQLLASLALPGASGHSVDYRLILLVAAASCALGAAPVAMARKREIPCTRNAGRSPIAAPLSERDARLALPRISGSVCVAALATGLVLPFYNVYMSERLGASVQEVGVLFAAGSLLMVPCSLLGPVVARKWGMSGAVAGPRALVAPFLLLPALFASPWAASTTFIARAGLMSSTFPSDNTFAMELMPPRMRAVQAGIRSASWNLSWSVASLISGQVIVAFGYPVIFVASAILHLARAAFFRAAIVPLRPQEPQVQPKTSGAEA